MPTMTGVLWTRATGEPRRLATLVVAETGAVTVSYDGGAIADRLPGMSLLHDLAVIREAQYPPTYANPLPPPLAELAPPPHPAGRLNPQRVIVEALAERLYAGRGWRPANQQQREWDMLLLCGRGSVGVMDVFSSDEQALDWYRTQPREADLLADADGVAAMFRAVVASTAMVSPEIIAGARGAALPSLGGMMPKVLARFDPASGTVTLDLGGGAPAQRPGVPVVVKIEPKGYEGVVELEELAYRACASVGLPVPRVWRLTPPDFRPMLAVERIDLAAGRALPMETAFSLLYEATARRPGPKVTSPVAAPYEMLAAALKLPAMLGMTDRAAAGRQLFRQVTLSLLIGNGDLHMRNLALLGRREECRLTPVYDPAPMRAWDEHNIVAACNLGGLDLERAVAPDGLGAAVAAFAAHCGVPRGAVADEMERCFAAAAEFMDGVRACGAPERARRNLLQRAAQVLRIIQGAIPPKSASRRRRTTPGET